MAAELTDEGIAIPSAYGGRYAGSIALFLVVYIAGLSIYVSTN